MDSYASPAFQLLVALPGVNITVLSSGGLTSADGTSIAMSALITVSAGTWGDAVADVATAVYSHRYAAYHSALCVSTQFKYPHHSLQCCPSVVQWRSNRALLVTHIRECLAPLHSLLTPVF